jgi:ribosomal protein L11 methyltransferase
VTSSDQGKTSTYRLRAKIGREVVLREPDRPERKISREDFYEWLWTWLDQAKGFLGAHEGTLLSETAAEQGLETESWTVDSAEAPRERDWVGGQRELEAELYFTSRKAAESASRRLESVSDVKVVAIEEQPERDWDAEWKASFLGSAQGLKVPPLWRIIPYWVSDEQARIGPSERAIRINPGAGFGTGTHETTQLCLQAIAECAPAGRALDFGSGSGILSIGLAKLGCEVDSIEIDPLAIDNARENAKINGVDDRIRFERELSEEHRSYRLVVANILRPVLLEFAERLVSRLSPGGALILSGLIERDVQEVRIRYEALLGRSARVENLGEWRCIHWGAVSQT